MKNVLKPLAKSVFMPLGSTAAAAAEADARTHKKILGSRTKILINVKIKK